MNYRIYYNKRPYSNKHPPPWFENKTHDHVHYTIIKSYSNERQIRYAKWGAVTYLSDMYMLLTKYWGNVLVKDEERQKNQIDDDKSQEWLKKTSKKKWRQNYKEGPFPSTADHEFQIIQIKCSTSEVAVSEKTKCSKSRTHKYAYN